LAARDGWLLNSVRHKEAKGNSYQEGCEGDEERIPHSISLWPLLLPAALGQWREGQSYLLMRAWLVRGSEFPPGAGRFQELLILHASILNPGLFKNSALCATAA
jgi:hypothetical protein